MTLRLWLRQPIVLTRRVAIAAGLTLGLLAAAGIVGVAYVADDIKDDRRTNDEVADIARRVFNIETPTDAELQDRIVRALRLCQRKPECRRLFGGVVRTSVGATSPTTRRLELPATDRAGPQTTRLGDPGDASPGPGPTGRVPAPGDASPGPPRPNAPAPRPPSAPAPPRIFDLDVPSVGPITPPSLCTPIIGLNCR